MEEPDGVHPPLAPKLVALDRDLDPETLRINDGCEDDIEAAPFLEELVEEDNEEGGDDELDEEEVWVGHRDR
jgi:hypothetical protein